LRSDVAEALMPRPLSSPTIRWYPQVRVLAGEAQDQLTQGALVWRELVPSGHASRVRETYSFVPNLVWLASQVSKLSDREGSFVQTYLQALSWSASSLRLVIRALEAVRDGGLPVENSLDAVHKGSVRGLEREHFGASD
jgi:hypothetical protein